MNAAELPVNAREIDVLVSKPLTTRVLNRAAH